MILLWQDFFDTGISFSWDHRCVAILSSAYQNGTLIEAMKVVLAKAFLALNLSLF